METDRIRVDEGFPIQEGNPELHPERIETTDFQLFYQDKRFSGAITLFYSEQQDLIREVEDEDSEQILNLHSIVRTRGVELELAATPAEHLELTSAVTYQESFDAGHNRSIMPVPNTIVKLGLVWRSPRGVSVGLHDSWFSAAPPVEDLYPVQIVNPQAEAFHNLTLNVTYELSDRIDLSLYGNNLLDEDIFYVEHTSQSINTIPGRPGRAIFFSVGSAF
jgi:outer membrane receptor for ferrienterochelin and colicins